MLRWQHKHSADMPRWLKLLDDGADVPPVFHEQPEIWPQAAFYWQAFSDLSADRMIGMGLGPIPFSAMLRYARLHGFTIDDFDRLRQIVGEIDGAYLAMNAPAKSGDAKTRSLVPINDAAAVGALLDRFGK